MWTPRRLGSAWHMDFSAFRPLLESLTGYREDQLVCPDNSADADRLGRDTNAEGELSALDPARIYIWPSNLRKS